MKTIDYWKAAKRALGNSSDYALAKRLEITRASASLLANGHSVMSNTTAAKIAELLELDPLKVIADCELERGTNDELWRRLARRVACVALAALGAAGQPSPTQAAGASPLGPQSSSEARLCIMSNRRRRPRGSAALGFLRALAAL